MTSATKPIRHDTKQGRFYDVGGRMLPSVTHVLSALAKPALIGWAAKEERTLVLRVAGDVFTESIGKDLNGSVFAALCEGRLGKERSYQRTLSKAGEIGSQVHGLIEWTLRQELSLPVGTRPVVADPAEWAFMAFQDWEKSVSLKPMLVEQTVFSLTHGYAGTMDLLALVNGEPALVDFKSGKSVYPEAHMQSAAYQHALIEMGLGQPARGYVVRLPKVETDPAFEVVTVENRDVLHETFLSLLQVWAWWHQATERKSA